MNFIEFLGFIISFAALIFLFVKRMVEDRKRRLNPEEYARREAIQEENLRKFMHSMHMDSQAKKQRRIESEDDDDEDDEVVAKPSRPEKVTRPSRPGALPPKHTPSSTLPPLVSFEAPSFSYDQKSSSKYEVIRQERVSPASKVLNGLKSPKDMLIIKEIFGPPLSMRHPRDEL